MADRPGMMIYFADWRRIMDTLSDAQFKRLFKLVICAAMGEETETLDDDPMLKLVGDMILDKTLRDLENYERKVETRKEAGRRGGVAKSSKSKQTLANDSNGVAKSSKSKQTLANDSNGVAKSSKSKQTPVNLNVDLDVNQDPNENLTPTVTPTEAITVTGNSLSPLSSLTNEEERGNGEREFPRVADVLNYARRAGREGMTYRAAEQFVTAQEARGWTDSNGNPIRDWKSWFDGWYLRNRPTDTSSPSVDPRVTRLEEMKQRYLAEEANGNDEG